MTVPVATGVAVLIIILAAVGAGAAMWWLVRLIQWLWERRPHGLAGRHDWIEWLTINGEVRRRLCLKCGRDERVVQGEEITAQSTGKVEPVD